MLKLEHSINLLKLLAEPTRLRLLLLLAAESLTVAELTAITGLGQSRVSTHLGRLREAKLVSDQARGNANLYSADPKQWDTHIRPIWGALVDQLDDALLRQDQERAAEIVRRRSQRSEWVESVAGRMEKQYSPGRTWSAMATALIELLELGDVLDIASGDGVLAELLCRRARSITCLDRSQTVINAAQKRLAQQNHVRFKRGDMHELPFADGQFDQVFSLHALTYSQQPEQAIREAARVLRPGGHIIIATLARHDHKATVLAYDHVNLGFEVAELKDWLEQAGLKVASCHNQTRENQPPYFRVVTAHAQKPAAN